MEFQDGARLSLDCSLVLRQGPLGSTALSVIPGIRQTFPARMLQVNETKWRSQGRLECPGGSTVQGWAIHEGWIGRNDGSKDPLRRPVRRPAARLFDLVGRERAGKCLAARLLQPGAWFLRLPRAASP